MRCIVWWDLSLIMASFFLKALRCFKKNLLCFKCTSNHWSKPVPRKWRGPMICLLLLFKLLNRFLIPVPMTDSLFVSLCKRGCPYFHTGSLVHRWQVVFGSALLHRVHFWLMARLTSQRWLWHFPPLLYLYYDSATGDADWFTFRISHYMYMYSAFGDVDWYPYYVSLHVCIPPLAMMTDHFPFIY